MLDLQCVHSKAIASLFPSWEDHWTIADLEDTHMSYKVFCNPDIQIQTFLDQKRFLAAIQTDGDVTLMFTVGTKQKFPLCTRVNCSKQTKCSCYRKYRKILEGDGEEDEERSPYYWERRTRQKPALVAHYMENLPLEEHHRKHGYNKTSFEYPIKRCPEMQQKFLSRLEGVFDLPASIVPAADDQSECCHSHSYVQDDDQLKMMSPNITIYTEMSDRIFPIPTYGRPTEGGCKCFDQADTHDILLWNLGSGKFVDYVFIHNHFHTMISSGIAMNASFNARNFSLGNIGVKSSLTYSSFLRACTGYAQMIKFRKTDFICPNPSCGDSPKYIVCDGKTDGPTKRKVEHLHELDKAEDDDSPLCQGSLFADRVFLSDKKERKLVCNLLTDTISAEDFADSDIIESANGNLVLALVERLSLTTEEIPKPYRKLLGNICKISSVAGYLQVLSAEPLDSLAEFCLQQLDIRATENAEIQKKVKEEMPALWPNLVDILNLEHTVYLPEDVSRIILKLIEIRKSTFRNAATRSTEDYIDWEDPDTEHPTQFYPNWPIFRYPKKYIVRNTADCEFCCKAFNKHTDFLYGVFSVGCACELNITYGYELMLCKESAHNIFRLLMSRDLNLHSLQGVIFDHACGLDQYILNREPSEFEFLRCLVDGAHWQVNSFMMIMVIK